MVINPNEYRENYEENTKGGKSDIYKQMSADLELMNAQWNVDNAWYDAHESAQARFAELRDLGINPLSAARAVAGNPQNMSPSSSPTVSGTGADSSAVAATEALTNAVGAVNSGVQTDLQRQQTRANVNNLNSQTANNLAQNPFIGGKMKSEIAKNNAEALESEAHVGTLNAQQQAFIAQANLSDKEVQQIEQVMSRYDDVTDAQITLWQNQSNLYFEEAQTQSHVRANLDADIILKGAQANEANARASESAANARFIDQETQQLMTINNFVNQTGIPLNASDLHTLNYYEARGEYDKAQRYLNTIFDCAASRESGVQAVSVPADIERAGVQKMLDNTYDNPSTVRGYILKKYEDLWRNKPYYNPTHYNYRSQPVTR